MGMLQINAWGSFPTVNTTFRAQSSGHAVAVDDAIKYLQDLKEEAVAIDKVLRKQDKFPDDRFREADLRVLLKEKP